MPIEFNSIQDIQAAFNGKTEKNDLKSLKKACQLFESLFLNELFKEMRKTIPQQGLIKEQNSDRIYKSMLDQEYATRMAESGGIGLGDMLYKQLSKNIVDKKMGRIVPAEKIKVPLKKD